MPRSALYDDALFREHDAGEGHPERAARLDAIRRGLRESGLEGSFELLKPRAATDAEILQIHTQDHLALLASTAGRTVRFDPDTQASPRSYEAARHAAGAVVDAVGRVMDGALDSAMCLVRPPGHHALRSRAMGFCLLNNVAIGAAEALRRGLTRILIVDFDVHHGNGTQDAFYEDPRVLYVSSHEYPFYPGTGSLAEVGEGAGRGFTVNLPLPAGAGDAEYAAVYRRIVEPIGRAFDPELVLVSMGFDAHEADPLARMGVTEWGFSELTRVCLEVASGAARGRCVFALEGGYHLEGLARSASAVAERLLGLERGREELPEGRTGSDLVKIFRGALGVHWPVLVPRTG